MTRRAEQHACHEALCLAGACVAVVHNIDDAIEELGTRSIPLTIIEPTAWKKFHGLRGGEKEASRQRALMLFPSAHALLARKKDHGRAEAALIALSLVPQVSRHGGRTRRRFPRQTRSPNHDRKH